MTKKKKLIEEIARMEEEYEKWGDEIKEKKGELENLRKLKLQGNIVRSRAKWVNEGETFLI